MTFTITADWMHSLTSGEVYLPYLRMMDILFDNCFENIPKYAKEYTDKWVKDDLIKRGIGAYQPGQYIEVKVPGVKGLYTLKATHVDTELRLVYLEQISYVY